MGVGKDIYPCNQLRSFKYASLKVTEKMRFLVLNDEFGTCFLAGAIVAPPPVKVGKVAIH